MARITISQREALDVLSAADLKWREVRTLAYERARRIADAEVQTYYDERRRLAVQAVDLGISKRRVYLDGLHTSDAKGLDRLLSEAADEKAPHMATVEKTPAQPIVEPAEEVVPSVEPDTFTLLPWNGDEWYVDVNYRNFPTRLSGWTDYPEVLSARLMRNFDDSIGWQVVEDRNVGPDPREQFANNPLFGVPGPIVDELKDPHPDGLLAELNAWWEAQK